MFSQQKEQEEKAAAAEEQARLEESGGEDSKDKEIVPMFFSEMTMDSGDKGLIFKPDRLTFIDSINEVIKHFQVGQVMSQCRKNTNFYKN